MAVASDLPQLENQRAVPLEQEQLGPARLPRPQARDPHEQPERRARGPVPDRAGDEARHDRDRGQALLHEPRLRPQGHRARAVGRRRRRRLGAGRLDDHAAVREGRARGARRAHGLPEAARGRARLPPHAQVVEGQDPHRVPQRDLLRQRRLRDRVGRARVLRQAPRLADRRRLRLDAREHVREPADDARGGVPRGDHPVAVGLRPDRAPGRLEKPPRHGPALHARPGLHHAERVRRTTCRIRCRRKPT